MAHEWSPADLSSDFKLFEWDFARNDKITLDANGGIISIADNWQGRIANTSDATKRRTIGTFNGVQGAYKPGSSSNTDPSGLILNSLTGLPLVNADRYIGFAVVHADGIIGGYAASNRDYWIDTPFNPGYRVHYDAVTVTSQTAVNRTDAHFVSMEHASSVTTLRADGVSAGTYNVTLNTGATTFGIAGNQASYYTMMGYTFYAIVGKRAPTQDERWLIEAWVAKYKTKRTAPADNPYRTALPQVPDSGFTPDNVGQPSSATPPALSPRAVVQPADAAQVSSATSPSAAARGTAQADSAAQGSASSSPTLAIRGMVQPDALAEASSSTSPALVARSSLAVDGAAQASFTTAPSVASRASIAPSDAAQAQASTSPQVAPTGSVMPGDTAQASVSTAPALASRSTVTPASVSQGSATSSPSIATTGSVPVDSAQQATTCTGAPVQSRGTASPANAAQVQATTAPQITAKASLSVNSASQAQSVGSPILFVGARPLPPSSRTVRTNPAPRLVTSPRPSRLAA